MSASPVHELLDRLETERRSSIEELAVDSGPLQFDAVQRIALLHSALNAVRDEIKIHEVKIGGGSENALE